MNPYIIIAALVAALGIYVLGDHHGTINERQRLTAQIEKERADGEVRARMKESMWQGVVNGTVKNYEAKVAGIRSNLDAALDSLRNRPERPAGMSEAPRAGCEGANGPELGRSNAGFLERYAARAAGQDAALAACYQVLDGVR